MDALETALAHYGVKGMRWGIRKRSTTPAVPSSEDAQKAETIRARSKAAGTNALSNAELRAAIERMNLEQQYGKLVVQTAPKSAGRKFVESILGEVGKEEVKRVAKASAAIKVEDAFTGEKRSGADFTKAVGQRIKPKKK